MPIRCAHVRDVAPLAALVNGCAEYGLMLHRSLSFLYEHVRDFHVAVEAEKGQERLIGCCGLSIVWANLAEVYSLAVAAEHRGRGVGRRLVEAAVGDARAVGVNRLMALTYEPGFFGKLGFEVVERQALPLKVWSECLRCPKNQACDEIAMIRVLADVAAVQAPATDLPPQGARTDEYFVPVVLRSANAAAPDVP